MICFHSLPFRGMVLSYGATLVVAVNDMSCELEELLYHLLLKIKALSAPRQLSSRHMVLRYLVKHRLLTLTIVA